MILNKKWDYKDKNLKLRKVINPTIDELESLSNEYNIDIDILKESFDLEQYPYFKIINDNIWTIIIDIPVLSKSINLFSIPIQIIVTTDEIILISKIENEEIKGIERLISLDTHLDSVLMDILDQSNQLFLQKLKDIKRKLDVIMNDVYINNKYQSSYEHDVSKMKVELVHYVSSLNTNNMVLNQCFELFEKDDVQISKVHESMIIDSTQAIDIVHLYLDLIENLLQSFELQQNKIVEKRVDRLTIMTISLTIPNIVFGFYGMNVKLPYASYSNAWSIIMILTFIVGLLVFTINYKKKG